MSIDIRPEHIADRPVSARTYRNYGCRCPLCTQAATEAQRKHRNRHREETRRYARIQRQQRRLAWQWIREHRPDIVAEIRSTIAHELEHEDEER